MKRSILNLASILLLVAGSFSCMISCKKEHPVENPDQVCGVDNPLTDLEWLRQRVADLASSTTHARITQCTYDTNKIGFLIEPCVGCFNIMSEFVNCDGIVLCIFGGVVGSTCQEFNIDYENEKIIWEINKN